MADGPKPLTAAEAYMALEASIWEVVAELMPRRAWRLRGAAYARAAERHRDRWRLRREAEDLEES